MVYQLYIRPMDSATAVTPHIDQVL